MKLLLLVPLLVMGLISGSAHAITLSVTGPCELAPWIELEVDQELVNEPNSNVGAATVAILESLSVPYLGDERGIAQINDSPLGDGALEIISTTEMKTYGWCFEVDGVQPALYPNEVELVTVEQSIDWFYGYAHYKDGEWIAACNKAALEQPEFICPL